MEELLQLIPVLLIYLLAATSSSRKKKKTEARHAKRSPMRNSAQGEQVDMRMRRRTLQVNEGFSEAFEHKTDPSDETKDEILCKERPVHLHDVTPLQMEQAGEGEDPCHAGGLEPAVQAEPVAENDSQSALAQDIVSGLIMSEVLLRPQERRALKRNRQGYHG